MAYAAMQTHQHTHWQLSQPEVFGSFVHKQSANNKGIGLEVYIGTPVALAWRLIAGMITEHAV